MKNLIAVTIGDIKGIGIHILINEWKKRKVKNFVIFSNHKIFKTNLRNLLKDNQINIIKDLNNDFKYHRNKINIYDIKAKNRYENTLESLKEAHKYCLNDKFIGILTLPLNKKEINKFVDIDFIDQTTFYSNLENTKISNMIFAYKKKFFIPLSTHIELKKVYKYFKNKNYILNKILDINTTLKKDFKIKNPRIILSGINPHSGEGGLISMDENKYIEPIIKKLKNKKINIIGPISGDAMINEDNIKKYDAFVFTYHDQALIPFKIISKYQGVNFTSNLKIIRASPSHGTAKDMINQKNIKSKGITNSFKIIRAVYKNRNQN